MATNSQHTRNQKLETTVAVMQRDIEYLKSAADDQKKLSEAIVDKIDSLSFVSAKQYEKDMQAIYDKISEVENDLSLLKKDFDDNKPGIRFSTILENKVTTFIIGALVAAMFYFLIQSGVTP